MYITAFLSVLSLVFLTSVQANAATITQVLEFDDLRSFEVDGLSADGRMEYFFEPFDASLGMLTDVSLVASATSSGALEQFECPATNVSCTVEFPLLLFMELGLGNGIVDEGGNFTVNQSGTHFGGVSDFFFPSISNSAPFGWDVDDFYTTPLYYLAFYEWRCIDCSSIDNPLMINVRGNATLTYEYEPAAVPDPSTLLLFVLGLLVLRNRVSR